MTYLDRVANRIRAHVPASDLPEEDAVDLFRIYAVLFLAKGQAVGASDVHNAWVAWMVTRDPSHKALVPYEDLPPAVAAHDLPYVEAIRALAQEAEL